MALEFQRDVFGLYRPLSRFWPSATQDGSFLLWLPPDPFLVRPRRYDYDPFRLQGPLTGSQVSHESLSCSLKAYASDRMSVPSLSSFLQVVTLFLFFGFDGLPWFLFLGVPPFRLMSRDTLFLATYTHTKADNLVPERVSLDRVRYLLAPDTFLFRIGVLSAFQYST